MPPLPELRISLKTLFKFTIILLIINFVLLAGTALVHSIFARTETLSVVLNRHSTTYILSQFNLAAENTFATWFSSFLLMITSFLAIICYLASTNDAKHIANARFSKGWLIIGAIFLLLSLDEAGSIHENAGYLSSLDIIGDQSWESVLAIPIVLVALYILAFSWFQLRRYPGTYTFMVLGTLLFTTIPFQEHLEMSMWRTAHYEEKWNRPIGFVLLEEGSELFGALSFIVGLVIFLYKIARQHGSRTVDILLTSKDVRSLSLSISGVSLTFLAFYILRDLPNADEGIAINWFPGMMAVLASGTYLLFHPRKDWMVSLYALIVAAYMGFNFYAVLYWSDIATLRLFVQWIMVAGLVYYVYSMSAPSRNAMIRFLYIVAGLLILPAFIFAHPLVTITVFAGFAVIVFIHVKEGKEVNLLAR